MLEPDAERKPKPVPLIERRDLGLDSLTSLTPTSVKRQSNRCAMGA